MPYINVLYSCQWEVLEDFHYRLELYPRWIIYWNLHYIHDDHPTLQLQVNITDHPLLGAILSNSRKIKNFILL